MTETQWFLLILVCLWFITFAGWYCALPVKRKPDNDYIISWVYGANLAVYKYDKQRIPRFVSGYFETVKAAKDWLNKIPDVNLIKVVNPMGLP